MIENSIRNSKSQKNRCFFLILKNQPHLTFFRHFSFLTLTYLFQGNFHVQLVKIHFSRLIFLRKIKSSCKNFIFSKIRMVRLFKFSSLFTNLKWNRKSLLKIEILFFYFSIFSKICKICSRREENFGNASLKKSILPKKIQ